MLVTEQEASQTWCPYQGNGRAWQHSMAHRPAGAALGIEQRSCIGSQCMAWRWQADARSVKPVGYCGLAGVVRECS